MVRWIPFKVYTDNYTYSLFILLSAANHQSSWSSPFICDNNENGNQLVFFPFFKKKKKKKKRKGTQNFGL
jgi:hypothetical protein